MRALGRLGKCGSWHLILAMFPGLLLGACGGGPHTPMGPFAVGGSVTGLEPNNSITLSDGIERITLSKDGAFAFAALHPNHSAYKVFIATLPAQQQCAMTYGAGVVNASDVTSIRVTCGMQPAAAPAWTLTAGAALTARYAHTSTLLLLPGATYGAVLAAGGTTGTGALNSSMLYSPATDGWTATANLGTARYRHTATWLPGINKVLVAGGSDGTAPVRSAELFDPATGSWTPTGSLLIGRYGHTATLLNDGRVLVAGGLSAAGAVPLAEIYDPAKGTWTQSILNHLQTARYDHSATLLPDGTVLVAGGLSNSGATLVGSELYDPVHQTWAYGPDLPVARSGHTATMLPTGKVLVAGGNSGGALGTTSAALYDWATHAWTAANITLPVAPYDHTATLLPSGLVLLAGGGLAATALASAELYDPAANTWSATASMNSGRQLHADALLLSGKVLVSGGANGAAALGSSELYW